MLFDVTQDTLSSGNATPTSTGMMGGYPGTTNEYKYVKNSDIQDRIRSKTLIDDIAEVAGEPVTLQLRQVNFEQTDTDVYSVVCSAAGGFGDPLGPNTEILTKNAPKMSPKSSK